jgi:hypothetical protein
MQIYNVVKPRHKGHGVWASEFHLGLRQLFGLLYQPRMMDDDVCGAVGRKIGRGIEVLREHMPSLVP